MLIAKNICKRFNGLNVLEDVSFEYTGKGVLGVVGPNSSGKTTLANIISGNNAPTSGHIIYKGQLLNGYPLHKRASLGIVRTYQDGKTFPFHTVIEHLMLIRSIEKNENTTLDMENLIERVGLKEKMKKFASTLSFGQKRRLEIAMAMMRDGELYLFDEPTSGVDPGFIMEFKDIVRSLTNAGKGIIIIEHNLGFLSKIADQIVVLAGGKILAIGSPEAVFQRRDVQDVYLAGGVYAS